jgi:hypothetical protein
MDNKAMTEYYSVVIHKLDAAGLLTILDNTKANEVVIFSEIEWEFPGLTRHVLTEYKNKNVNIKVVLGSFNTVTEYETIYWPTHWINWARTNLKYVTVTEFDIEKVKYPFISLNNRSHYHRCVFIDEMAKQNLLDKGIVTWVKHLNENPNYPYKYFDNRQILLNDGFDKKLDSFLIPEEYNQSLFHIVTEATDKAAFITEKTIIPTLLKKPYIAIGSHEYNRRLVELGFKLYDEIFDYTFDSEPDIFKRTELFVNSINSILNIDLGQAYNLLLPKIIYNYNHALTIIKDKSLIPNIVKECVANNGIDNMILGRYQRFLHD